MVTMAAVLMSSHSAARRSWLGVVFVAMLALTTSCDVAGLVAALTEVDVPAAIVGPTMRDTTRLVLPDTITHGVPFTLSFYTTGSSCVKRVVSTGVSSGGQDTIIVRPIDRASIGPCGDAVQPILLHSATAVFPDTGRGTIRLIGALVNAGGATAIVDRNVTVR